VEDQYSITERLSQANEAAAKELQPGQIMTFGRKEKAFAGFTSMVFSVLLFVLAVYNYFHALWDNESVLDADFTGALWMFVISAVLFVISFGFLFAILGSEKK